MTEAYTPVVVLGGGITTLGVIRILAHAGIPAFVLPEGAEFVRYSRHYRRVPAPPGGPDPTHDLPGWLERLPFTRAVLMPCSDHWVQRVAGLDPSVAVRFPASVSSAATLARIVDKTAFAELTAAAGVPHPETWAIERAADLDAVPDQAFASAFLKPRDSQTFFAKFGAKAFRVASRQDAHERFRLIEPSGLKVQLQVYVQGPPTEHYFIDGFSDASTRIRALFARQRLRMYPPDFGNSTYMRSVPLDDVADAVESVRRLVAALQFRGVFSCEFKRDARDGRFRVIEMNPRPWWYVRFAARSGVDVCTMAYHDALGEPVPEVREYQIGRGCVYPYYDYFAVRHAGGGTLWLDWLWAAASADQPVFEIADPLPALRETFFTLRRRFRRGREGQA